MPINAAHNSILFDFFSIVDKETSVFKFIVNECETSNTMDLSSIINLSDHDLCLRRTYWPNGLIHNILKSEYKDRSSEIIENFYNDNEKEILSKYAVTTNMKTLISGYSKTGMGVIQTAVRCDNKDQYDFICENINAKYVFIEQPKNVAMDKYSRFIFGSYKNPFDYPFDNPKSILILNFRENFSKDNIEVLNPELVISLGDIHDIQVVDAYSLE